ncbi:hypothetical protein B551_0222555 [Cupriavidus sp. HPC(L)]|uniref:hypothetical protein n=1 Tax=Cupriavidus sp. HPC(L) TaxID=1217418 RepID=UPI000291BD30|nr:hypothetical protein [Cupriavidus sp. HPC(L)]ESH90755.1 hypothetical protein B551_0222555 [Cupriavidus sp. HPC(L)]
MTEQTQPVGEQEAFESWWGTGQWPTDVAPSAWAHKESARRAWLARAAVAHQATAEAVWLTEQDIRETAVDTVGVDYDGIAYEHINFARAIERKVLSRAAPTDQAVGHVFTMAMVPGEPPTYHAKLYVELPAGTRLFAAPQPCAQQAAAPAGGEAWKVVSAGERADEVMARCPNCGHPFSVAPAEEARGVDAWTEVSRFLTDVMTAAGLVSHGKQSKALGNRLGRKAMELRSTFYALLAAPAAGTGQDDPLRDAVEAMVRMLEDGEWAEHVATTTGKGDALAHRLEAAITDLHNQMGDTAPQAATGAQGLTDERVFEIAEQYGWTRKGDAGQWIVCNSNAAANLPALVRAILAQAAPASLHAESVKENAESLQRGDAALAASKEA